MGSRPERKERDVTEIDRLLVLIECQNIEREVEYLAGGGVVSPAEFGRLLARVARVASVAGVEVTA